MLDRRRFLTRAALATAAVSLSSGRSARADEGNQPLDRELVGRFVGKSHRDIDAVREMLDQQPALANAAWDWGSGDWETGLGAAAHVGRPEIANLILERGARIDIYSAVMLGHRKIVSAFLEEVPTIHRVRGPHGIPLLSHAIVGREAAASLVQLLIERGADVNAQSRIGMSPLMVAASIGSVDAIDLLLTHGADRSLKDLEENTALDWARGRGHAAAAKRLEDPK